MSDHRPGHCDRLAIVYTVRIFLSKTCTELKKSCFSFYFFYYFLSSRWPFMTRTYTSLRPGTNETRVLRCPRGFGRGVFSARWLCLLIDKSLVINYPYLRVLQRYDLRRRLRRRRRQWRWRRFVLLVLTWLLIVRYPRASRRLESTSRALEDLRGEFWSWSTHRNCRTRSRI